MTSYKELYLEKRPQSLCLMCGRCCRVATTTHSYEKLQEMADFGDEYAAEFLKIFEPYESIDDARKVDAQIVDNIIRRSCDEGDIDEKSLTFYHCKYILPDNTCSIYEERPTLCEHCPSTPWSVVPPGCGFEAWLFLKREEAKQKVRKCKEDLIELNILKGKMNNPEDLAKINSVINKINGIINSYKKYGSENW